jgi:hypothetical protein
MTRAAPKAPVLSYRPRIRPVHVSRIRRPFATHSSVEHEWLCVLRLTVLFAKRFPRLLSLPTASTNHRRLQPPDQAGAAYL